VVDEPFRPLITALGARHPVTEDLPGANVPGRPGQPATWGSWYRRIEPIDVHGEVLMQAPDGARCWS